MPREQAGICWHPFALGTRSVIALVSLPTLQCSPHPADLVSLSACTQLRTLSIHLLGDFKWDDPNWAVLNTITSPYLEEIKICSFDGYVAHRDLKGWEEVDDMLCQNHDRSLRNGVGGFRVSLHPTDIDLGDEFVLLMECVRDVWPRFVKKGTLVLSLES